MMFDRTDDSSGTSKRIVIIGGGIAGLATAHRLLELRQQNKYQFEVILLEAGSRLGGVLQSHEREGFLLEAGADSFISEKPEAIELAKRLGLESHLIETNEAQRRSFIVRKGRLIPVPDGFQLMAPARIWPFITSGIFSWPGKTRMACELFIPRRRNPNGDDDESLAQFVRRRLGKEAFERMAQPMIGGIYTANPERLSLRATLPRFLEMEREHGSVIRAMWKQNRSAATKAATKQGSDKLTGTGTSGARYSLFLSFDRGMQVIVDELARRLPESSIQLNSPAQSVAFDSRSHQWLVQLSDDRSLAADALCLAVPAYTAASLLRQAEESLAQSLDRIEYASTATVNLAFRRSDVAHALDGFGFVVPFIEKRSILACTFSSVKFAGRAPEGHVLLRAFVGGALQPELFELAEDQIVQCVRNDLSDLIGIKALPIFTLIKKWRRSMPQYHVGHLELIAQIESQIQKLSGLELAGNAYGGAGVPDCIRSGETAAAELVDFLRTQGSSTPV